MHELIKYDKENRKFLINHETSVAEIMLIAKIIQNSQQELGHEAIDHNPEIIYEKYLSIMTKMIKPFNDILLKPIETMDCSFRVKRCLISENFFYIGDIICNPLFKDTPNLYRLTFITNFGFKSYKHFISDLTKYIEPKYQQCDEYLKKRFEITNEKYSFNLMPHTRIK